MDRFTKTTETDISNMNLEEATPQKSKAGKIIAIIISLLLSIAIWLYVVETDDTKITKEYNDVSVTIINSNDKFNITADKAEEVLLMGTNGQLVDIEASDIIVEIDASTIDKAGDYTVIAKAVYVMKDNTPVEFEHKTVSVTVHVKAAK